MTSFDFHEDEEYHISGLHFIWDKAKNEYNIQTHGVDFKTAALVFNDDYCLINDDYAHSDGEIRESITGQPIDTNDVVDISGLGSIPKAIIGAVDNVLFVVYTTRGYDGDEFYRIISARKADDDEKALYESLKYDTL